MRCNQLNIGDFDRLIKIQRAVTTPDGIGGNTSVWTSDPPAGVWAKLKNLTGTERWEAGRIMPGNLVRVIIRWRDDGSGNPYYLASDRIIHQGRTYTILGVFDLEFQREYIQIDMQEGKP